MHLLLTLLLLLLVRPVYAATYYVNGTSGTGTCSTANAANGCTGGTCARATINQGVSCLSSGDTLIIAGGTYTNQCLADVTTLDTTPIPAGLSASSPTRLEARTGETVTLKPQNPVTGNCPIHGDSDAYGILNFEQARAAHIQIKNINVDGNDFALYTLWTSSNYMVFDGGTHQRANTHSASLVVDGPNYSKGAHNIFRNMTLTACGLVGPWPNDPGLYSHCVYARASFNTYEHMTIGSTSHMGLQFSRENCSNLEDYPEGEGCPTGNVFRSNRVEGSGPIESGGPGNLVYSNLFLNAVTNYRGAQICYWGYGGTLYNNTFYNCGTAIYSGEGGSPGWDVKNNLIIGHASGEQITIGATGSFDKNICSNAGLGCTSTASASQVFTNAAGGNFMPPSDTAPNVNTGLTLADVSQDYAGTARPQGAGHDIGAYEFTTGEPTVPATYHVSTTGVDPPTRPCATAKDNASAPLLTITAGLGCLLGGDTLIVHAGTYPQRISNIPAGTATAPTTVQAAPGEVVTIRPSSAVDCTVWVQDNRNYTIVRGFILDGASVANYGVCVDGNATQYVTLDNLEVKNHIDVGMWLIGNFLTVTNNRIHNNGADTGDHGIIQETSDSLINNNHVYDNAGVGMLNQGVFSGATPSRNTYVNNRIDNQPGGAISLAQGPAHLVVHNTLTDSGDAAGQAALGCCGTNTQVLNNIVSHNPHYGLLVSFGDIGAQITNNVVFSNPDGHIVGTVNATVSGTVTGDPGYVNLAADDVHLNSSSSPARLAGLPLSSLPASAALDADGVARPSSGATDSGAYQFVGPVVPVPTDLTVTTITTPGFLSH